MTFNTGDLMMNPEILAIIERQTNLVLRELFGLSITEEEVLEDEVKVTSPKVQTHAAPTKNGLGTSHKKTMTSRLIAIPTGSSRIYKGSNVKLERIRAVAYYVNRQHNVVLNCTKTGYSLKVARVA
jgi:hypothetical protein